MSDVMSLTPSHGGLVDDCVLSVLLDTPAVCKNIAGQVKSDAVSPVLPKSLVTPRTPTPFKNALASLERQSGSVRVLDGTPNSLAEDIREVIDDDVRQMSRKLNVKKQLANSLDGEHFKENVEHPVKKVRKSLERKWSTPGDVHVSADLIWPETPSKSLVGDSSIIFSPPSIISETLHDVFDSRSSALGQSNSQFQVRLNAIHAMRFQETPSRSISVGSAPALAGGSNYRGWERVACGRTASQAELVRQAREIIGKTRQPQPRSLKL